MLKVNLYDHVEDKLLKFAVIGAKAGDKWVYCRHKDRDTFEIPGGHREPEEDILSAAKRELYEETGALKFDIIPVCAYSVSDLRESDSSEEETFGMLFYATIEEFGPLPNYEIEEIVFFDRIPENLTYPFIQPKLYAKLTEFIRCSRKEV